MTDENKTEETKSTALALNTQEALTEIQQEVQNEFITSDREVYKEGLRSLLVQEQKLRRQISQIEKEIGELHQAKLLLDEAFKNGTLHSVEDARGIVRKVRRNDDDFDL